MKFVVWCALLFACCSAVNGNTVWPKPYSQKNTGETFVLSGQRDFQFLTEGVTSDVLDEAYERYTSIVFGSAKGSRASESRKTGGGEGLIKGVKVNVATSDLSLTLLTDYNYHLSVEAPFVQINAPTAYGALYAMETMAQLTDGVFINGTSIQDQPRFKFRASMIDTSRHWLPLSVIFAHIDTMMYNKMNVLHWHIVDSVSFPYCSEAFPEMCIEGAYTQTHVYHRDDVQNVISYAALRGIRVIPEFDTPGHARTGYETVPDLLTPCYSGKTGKPDGTTGPFNPILPSTYSFLEKFYAEIKDVFPDKFVHVGGDEVSFDCWQSNPGITAWLKLHPEIKSYDELESYYEVQLLKILKKQNTSYIVWQEIFDNGVQILPDTVVDVWKGGDWQDEMGKVTSAGFHSVLSAPFYLNYISYGLDWVNYYKIEPTNFTCGNDGQACDKSLVGGIEQCMWAEFVDGTNFLSRVWPRTSAVAERAWSTEDTTDVNDAQIRLQEFRCKLLRRGIPAEPISNGGAPPPNGAFCDEEWMFEYEPPFNN